MIEVRGLRYLYPGKLALRGVGFTLAQGSITALIGPNGAGKTTLLRCLAGLDEPHAGSIRLDGIEVTQNPRAAHQRLGFLADHFGLHGELSAERCLLHAGACRGLQGAVLDQRVRQVAEQVGLTAQLSAAAGTLSRGQRQRLALAQAIIHQPAVLLLDEPASGLDPEARASLSSLMRRLAADGMTLVVSSHILAELEEYCTAMLVLRDGEVVEHSLLDGDPAATATATLAPRELRVRLADTAHAWPQSWPQGVHVIQLEASDARLRFEGDDAALAVLLAQLLSEGLPVCSFAIEEARLQDVYLASLGAAAHTP